MEILGRYKSHDVATKYCNLCLNETLRIDLLKGSNVINKPAEVVSKCRHVKRYSLTSYKI